MRSLLLAAIFLAVGVSSSFAEYDPSGIDQILHQYVREGRVDYQGLRKDARARQTLDQYLRGARDVSRVEYNNWSMLSKKAFWLNAYNALCLQQVLEKYPCEAQTLFRFALFPRYSPQNVEGFFSKKKHRVLDEFFSLDLIQRMVLLIRLHDITLLFGASPAARGGPRLFSAVYEGPHLKEQLEGQIKNTLSRPECFRVDRADHAVFLSEFFQHFGEDFIPLMDRTFDKPTTKEKERAVLEFLMDYLSKEDKEFLKDPTVKVHYEKFDWALNE